MNVSTWWQLLPSAVRCWYWSVTCCAGMIFAPYELPVGIVLSFIGAPLLFISADLSKGETIVIMLDHVYAGYGKQTCIEGITLQIPKGRITAIIRPEMNMVKVRWSKLW